MCKKTLVKISVGLLVLSGGGVFAAWSYGLFDGSVHNANVGANQTSETTNGNLSEALSLAKAAQETLHKMPGYKCIYLRDERIDNAIQENSLLLTVMHEPFSVMMEWAEPKIKSGRKAVYATGKYDGKMIVKQLFVRKVLDINESISLKESRHTIAEAGLKNLVDRFVTSWEEESKVNETNVRYSDATIEATVNKKKYSYPCRCVETDHPLSTKEKYLFHTVKIYFDKATGLPVRMEGYEWPGEGTKAGRLMEKYTYIDVQPQSVPSVKEFEL
ncbi:MAG TPA: DUF1571 domain-containing protein [Gemmatales bacterium]|nr:DUF1571 domain-containing protein [Gemmatales bacterium]